MNRCLALLLLVAPLARPVGAQRVPIDSVDVADTTRRHLVRLRDGTTLLGRITAVATDSIRLRTNAGEMSLGRIAVQTVEIVNARQIRNGEYWFENPHATRLLFSSTAFPLERGAGYYSNTWLVFHGLAAGITDRFTLGGGVFWFPGVALGEMVYFVLPKYTVVNRESAKLAVGALMGLLPFGASDARTPAGILYGVGTLGNRDSNLSGGLGWGYAGDRVANNPVLMIGGQHRFSRRLSLISENWFFPVGGETDGVYSYGLRFLGEAITVDLAYVSVLGETKAFPWLGFAVRW